MKQRNSGERVALHLARTRRVEPGTGVGQTRVVAEEEVF